MVFYYHRDIHTGKTSIMLLFMGMMGSEKVVYIKTHTVVFAIVY